MRLVFKDSSKPLLSDFHSLQEDLRPRNTNKQMVLMCISIPYRKTCDQEFDDGGEPIEAFPFLTGRLATLLKLCSQQSQLKYFHSLQEDLRPRIHQLKLHLVINFHSLQEDLRRRRRQRSTVVTQISIPYRKTCDKEADSGIELELKFPFLTGRLATLRFLL